MVRCLWALVDFHLKMGELFRGRLWGPAFLHEEGALRDKARLLPGSVTAYPSSAGVP